MARINSYNRGWDLPDLDEPANVPGDLQRLVNGIDVDMQVAFSAISLDTGWQPVTLPAGISEFNAAYTPQVRRVRANQVFLVGGVKTAADMGTSNAVKIGTLPDGFAPQFVTFSAQVTSGGLPVALYVDTAGSLFVTYRSEVVKAGQLIPISMSWLTGASSQITTAAEVIVPPKTGSVSGAGTTTDTSGSTGTYDSQVALAEYIAASGA